MLYSYPNYEHVIRCHQNVFEMRLMRDHSLIDNGHRDIALAATPSADTSDNQPQLQNLFQRAPHHQRCSSGLNSE